MKKKLLALMLCAFSGNVMANSVTWNLKSLYGITQTGFANAIMAAKDHFILYPNDSIIIQIDTGTYNIGGNGSYGIDLGNGINPGPTGRLIFQGAGMYNTTLVFTDIAQREIYGRNINRITFKDLHMTRAGYTVSQGVVDSVSSGMVMLDIQSGFPTPAEIFNAASDQGRFLRRYTNSTTDPQLITSNNDQLAWNSAELITGSRWKINLKNTTTLANYNKGDLVGIKSKHEGEIYWILGGSDILFENIRYTHASRGLARGGTSNLTIRGCRIERAAAINGQTPCLATPSGGFQMNQPGDPFSTGMVVERCYIESPGDDGVAFFNVNGGSVVNTLISNSFARGILIIDSAENICLSDDTLINCPIMGSYSECKQIPDSATICSAGSISFEADITGNTYQWQEKSGSLFTDISDNSFYSGTNTHTLLLNNVPSTWYGYTYRCLVTNNIEKYYGQNHILTFSSSWLGKVSTLWEDPANWSCLSIPDENTDVKIPAGTNNFPIVQSNAACRNLVIGIGASLQIHTGHNLKITGKQSP